MTRRRSSSASRRSVPPVCELERAGAGRRGSPRNACAVALSCAVRRRAAASAGAPVHRRERGFGVTAHVHRARRGMRIVCCARCSRVALQCAVAAACERLGTVLLAGVLVAPASRSDPFRWCPWVFEHQVRRVPVPGLALPLRLPKVLLRTAFCPAVVREGRPAERGPRWSNGGQ